MSCPCCVATCTIGLNVRANPYDYSLGAGINKPLEVSGSSTRACSSTESFSFAPTGLAAQLLASLSFSSGSWYCTIQTTFIISPPFRTYVLTYKSIALQATSNGLPSAQTLTLSDFSLLECLELAGLGQRPVSHVLRHHIRLRIMWQTIHFHRSCRFSGSLIHCHDCLSLHKLA